MSLSAPHTPLSEPQGDSPADLLTEAFLIQMARSGAVGATARAVAARAGVSPSAINYHFESIERLYGFAQAEAVKRARSWFGGVLDDIAPSAPFPPEAFPVFAADVIAKWGDEIILAQAEACAVQQIAWGGREAVAWGEAWGDFWRQAVVAFSLPAGDADVVSAVLQSERIGHLARWRPAHDRGALLEVCERLTARLTRDAALLARASVWREKAEALSGRTVEFPLLNPASGRIAAAVVRSVDEGGEAALTHRAAAAGAGVSLGAVTHHFPTRTALAQAGYAFLYESIVASARKTVPNTAAHGDVGSHIRSFLDLGRTAPGARALEVFFLAATRDASLSDFAARVRFSRGSSSWSFLREAAPHLTRLDGLLVSHLTSGLGRMIALHPERREAALDKVSAHADRMFRA